MDNDKLKPIAKQLLQLSMELLNRIGEEEKRYEGLEEFFESVKKRTLAGILTYQS